MRYRKPVTLLAASFCLLIACSYKSFGQQDGAKKITTRLTAWSKNHVAEKVYLHTDKPVYAAGEDIWFKAYLVSGSNHQLSELSKVLYVDLVDQADSISRSIKLPITNGITWGDFALPDNLPPGNYRLRAYTNYMRNEGPQCFFQKNILIGNAIGNNVFVKPIYTRSVVNNEPYTKIQLNYKDLNGIAYSQKAMSYQVKQASKTITDGKTITDLNGNAQFSFKAQAQKNEPTLLYTSINYTATKKYARILPVKDLSGKTDVHFFPESGELIAGIAAKVAYKITGANGLGIDATGFIKDQDNVQVADLGDTHFGMGTTTFTPQQNKKYTATVSLPDGTEISQPLPDVNAGGYSLSIRNNAADSLNVRINTSVGLLKKPGDELVLIAQQNGRAIYSIKFTPQTGITQTAVAKSDFKSGTAQFTLFSASGQPLCERLVFIQNMDLLNLNLSALQTTYAPRQKVAVNLNVVNAGHKTVPGSFSVSVINEAKVPLGELDENTILNHLLLISDLKGYIEKPNYYFTNVNDKTREYLDVLMLTQGYRHFVWKSVLNDTLAAVPAFKPETSITLTGTIKTPDSKAVVAGKVVLASIGDGLYLKDTVTDSQGRFEFNNIPVKDSLRYIVQAETSTGDRDVEIKLDKTIAPVTRPADDSFVVTEDADNTLMDYLKNSNARYQEELQYNLGNHTKVLKEVFIKERQNKPVIEHSDNLNGAGNANQIITADKLLAGFPLGMALNGLLTGVVFRGPGDTAYLASTQKNFMNIIMAMQVIVDGIYMETPFALNDIGSSEVQTIEVLRSPEYTTTYGNRGGAGVMIITTKRGGEDSGIRVSPGIINFMYKGFYAVRQFYSPKYDGPAINAKIPDLRTTAYWNPNLVTDANGNAGFEFFTPDEKGTYRIVIEGIDGYGAIGRQVYRYKVN
jgi:hypothetical protein